MAQGRKKNNVDILVGQRIRARRLEIGMSQEKLGERLGLSFQQVQKYERGTNRVGAGRLYELSVILGVEIPWFFSDVAPSTLTGPPPSQMSLHGHAIGRAFDQIAHDKVRISLLSLARELAQIGGAP
jgi:transcriptional regulator with XRE-family HTH domain